MPLPDVGRLVYRKNTLRSVICQLRFPPILRIGVESPAQFQEGIRQRYPFFAEVPTGPRLEVTLPDHLRKALPPEFSNLLDRHLAPAGGTPTEYQFYDEARKWMVTLTTDFLALTCTDYTHWEVFEEHLSGPVEQLRAVYSPPFLVRIGLRYQNAIVRSDLGLEDHPWSELLQPFIAGELASPDLGTDVEEARRITTLKLEAEGTRVTVRHGLGTVEGSKEEMYILDYDFYTTQNTEVGREHDILGAFSRQALRLFRSCISDLLHRALEPEAE